LYTYRMTRSFWAQALLLLLAFALLAGVVLTTTSTQNPTEEVALIPEQVVEVQTSTQAVPDSVGDAEVPLGAPPTSVPAPAPKPQPVPPKPQAPAPSPAPVPQEPTPAPQPAPTPVVWTPGFLQNARITPEIPSEAERALLPSCDGKRFTLDPVDVAAFTKIDGRGSTHGGAPYDFARIFLPTSTNDQLFFLYAPADIYITHVAQTYASVREEEETTIYFALCKDVFGYISNVKLISDPVYKLITDSTCLGKPHTGPNACYVQTLTLLSRSQQLGKVGGTRGSFGFGVFDLRTQRSLESPETLPIRTNFARCPIEYFARPDVYQNRLEKGGGLCD
jgi:hypothetical protein